MQEQAVTRATQQLQETTEKRNDELMKELAAKKELLLLAVARVDSLVAASAAPAADCTAQADADSEMVDSHHLVRDRRTTTTIGLPTSNRLVPPAEQVQPLASLGVPTFGTKEVDVADPMEIEVAPTAEHAASGKKAPSSQFAASPAGAHRTVTPSERPSP